MSDFTLESLAQTLSAESNDEARDDGTAQPEGEAQNDEQDGDGQQQDTTQDEGAETDASGDPEQDDGKAAGDDEGAGDQPAGESQPDRVHKWKTADGTEYEVPESDLHAGYMRAQDYTQKTQNLAREREQAESEIQNRATQQLQTLNLYGEKLGELHMARAVVANLESALQQTNRENDPARYAALSADLMNARGQAEKLTGMLGNANLLIQQQQTEQVKKAQQEAVKTLSAEMPDLKDRLPVWNRHATETYGFSPQELAQVSDPRVFRMLDDAAKFRDLQTRKPEAVKKAAAAPQKPAKQTRSTPPSTIETAVKRHQAQRDVNSLAAVLAASRR